jgi:hypothetical protein
VEAHNEGEVGFGFFPQFFLQVDFAQVAVRGVAVWLFLQRDEESAFGQV